MKLTKLPPEFFGHVAGTLLELSRAVDALS